jgi:hypothetical protein
MEQDDIRMFTPAEVMRRVTAMGVLANALIVWSYMRNRLAEAYPERAATAAPDALPVDEATFADWLDDFLDEAEAQRARLARAMNPLNDG